MKVPSYFLSKNNEVKNVMVFAKSYFLSYISLERSLECYSCSTCSTLQTSFIFLYIIYHRSQYRNHHQSQYRIMSSLKDSDVNVDVLGSASSAVPYRPVEQNAAEIRGSVRARRSGSATKLVTRSNGDVVIERTSSDLAIAVKNRNSYSTLPTMLPAGNTSTAEPVLSATDVLEKTGGKGAAGAYTEHMFTIEGLGEKFKVHIDVDDVPKSTGLLSQQARDLLLEFGNNVLTPPPRVPLWLLFLLQFTNFFMVVITIISIH